MAHYAKVNPLTYKVEQVIRVDDDVQPDFIDTLPDSYLWLQTSYNTLGGKHYDPDTGELSEDQSKALRYNFASVGYTYDRERDAFIAEKPHKSWLLNEDTCQWYAPKEKPSLEEFGMSRWDEETGEWVAVADPE